MAGGIDQVQVVDLPIPGGVEQRCRLRLDGDAALFFQIHGIEHLGTHFPVFKATAALDDAVSQCGLAVVDVGNDGKITNVVHLRVALCGLKRTPEKKRADSGRAWVWPG